MLMRCHPPQSASKKSPIKSESAASLIVLAVCEGLHGKALRVIKRGQFEFLHDLETNVHDVGAAAHPLRKGRHTAIRTFNQVYAE